MTVAVVPPFVHCLSGRCAVYGQHLKASHFIG